MAPMRQIKKTSDDCSRANEWQCQEVTDKRQADRIANATRQVKQIEVPCREELGSRDSYIGLYNF